MAEPTGAQLVDEYLAAVAEPQRATLAATRAQLLALLPDGVEGISYGMPVVKVGGKAVAGYAPATKHCSLYPHSGNVLPDLRERHPEEFGAYRGTKSALHFPLDTPLPDAIVRHVVSTRLAEIRERGR